MDARSGSAGSHNSAHIFLGKATGVLAQNVAQHVAESEGDPASAQVDCSR